MKKVKDLTGMRVGKLTVVSLSDQDERGRARWLCKCECGGSVIRKSSILVDAHKKGKASHCGCSPALKTHGLSVSEKRLHWVWAAIIQRCTNEKCKDYKDYGARGISICAEWRADFAAFCTWAKANGYAEGLSIDRIENEKGYTPDNCQWVGDKEQMRNQRKTVILTHEGQSMPLTWWAEKYGLSVKTLRARVLLQGWSMEKALTTRPVKGRNQHAQF